MKPFDPGRGSPKTENVSSCTTFLLPLNFQLLRKGSHAEGILFIFPCSLAFSAKCSGEEFGRCVSSSAEFSCFTCLPPAWLHLPACPGQSYRRRIPFPSRPAGCFCSINPPLQPSVRREEPRSCIASSYLPSVFQDAIAAFQNTERTPKTIPVDKFQAGPGEGRVTVSTRRASSEVSSARLPATSVLSLFDRSSHC